MKRNHAKVHFPWNRISFKSVGRCCGTPTREQKLSGIHYISTIQDTRQWTRTERQYRDLTEKRDLLATLRENTIERLDPFFRLIIV